MNSKNPRRVAITFGVLSIVFHTAASIAEPLTLTGTLTYRERVALPPIEVKLVDVTVADVPSKTVAETSMPAGGQGQSDDPR